MFSATGMYCCTFVCRQTLAEDLKIARAFPLASFFSTRRLSLWSIYPITLHAQTQTSFQSALNLANTGGVSLPGAKQVVHFPGWLQAGKQFFRHRGTQAPLTVAASAKRSWICLWRSSRDTHIEQSDSSTCCLIRRMNNLYPFHLQAGSKQASIAHQLISPLCPLHGNIQLDALSHIRYDLREKRTYTKKLKRGQHVYKCKCNWKCHWL